MTAFYVSVSVGSRARSFSRYTGNIFQRRSHPNPPDTTSQNMVNVSRLPCSSTSVCYSERADSVLYQLNQEVHFSFFMYLFFLKLAHIGEDSFIYFCQFQSKNAHVYEAQPDAFIHPQSSFFSAYQYCQGSHVKIQIQIYMFGALNRAMVQMRYTPILLVDVS